MLFITLKNIIKKATRKYPSDHDCQILLPLEYESNDKVRTDSDSPITLFPWRVRLGVVWRQNYPSGSADVASTCCWGQTGMDNYTDLNLTTFGTSITPRLTEYIKPHGQTEEVILMVMGSVAWVGWEMGESPLVEHRCC